MLNEPHWLSAEQTITINRLAVTKTREPFFIRDPAMLEGALASPRNHWLYERPRLPRLAATLLMILARDHPFQQGNKRTAFIGSRAFLRLNGLDLNMTDDEAAPPIIAMVERQLTSAEFSDWFAARVYRPVRIRNSARKLRN